MVDIDQSSGSFMPFYDEDTQVRSGRSARCATAPPLCPDVARLLLEAQPLRMLYCTYAVRSEQSAPLCVFTETEPERPSPVRANRRPFLPPGTHTACEPERPFPTAPEYSHCCL